MVKRTIKETVTEYDKDGNIVKQTVTETTEDDDTAYWPYNPAPYNPYPWTGNDIVYCGANTSKGEQNAESRRV